MQKRINKPKWAPSIYIKDMSAYRSALNQAPNEEWKYLKTYIDEYGLTIVYERETEGGRFKYKKYFSTSVYLYANEISQGLRLSNIIAEELANGYEDNAQALLWRNPKIKNFDDLIEAIKKDEEAER